MEFKATFFAIVIISLLSISIGVMINDWNIEYNSGLSEDLAGYNKLGEISSYTEDYENQLNPQSSEASSDTEAVIFRGVYSVLTGILAPISITFGLIQYVVEYFNLPSYIYTALITMIIAAVVFTLIAIIFRQLRSSV